jgi:MinD superfamily P-loop ATPase
MVISFASGKGGTGKTTVSTNFALALAAQRNDNLQFLDCDVEEPNASIFLKPEMTDTIRVSIPVPEVDFDTCNFCGMCAQVCAYNALAVLKDTVLTFSHLCHGCGGCRLLCPQKAITEGDREIGVVEIGNAGNVKFVQGKLNVGEALSPPVIRAVKAYVDPRTVVIIDVPPGTSCPVIEAVKGSDFTVLVTEPTPFGLHDLMLAVETLRKLGILFGVVINRSDKADSIITNYCEEKHIPILMRIPASREIAIAYSKGIPMIQIHSTYRDTFRDLYHKITKLLAR